MLLGYNFTVLVTDLCFYFQFLQTTTSNLRTERSNFSSILSDSTKRFIAKHGPCQPENIQFPKNSEGRSFSLAYYNQKSKSGIAYRRNWLCYSPTLDVAYCEPCWVFGDKTQTHGPLNWANGFNDWRHISQSITIHECSNNHLFSCQIYNK